MLSEDADMLGPAPSNDMLDVFQTRLTAKLQDDEKLKVMDPTMWIGLLTAVAGLATECMKKRNKAEVTAAIRNPTMLQRLAIRRKLIQEVGRAKVRDKDAALVDRIVAVAKEATVDEVAAFLDQVKNG